MSNYVITYYGFPRFAGPEDGSAYMAKWRAWMGDVGDAMVNPGAPMSAGKTISSTGVTDSARQETLTGFSIVSADSLDDAVALAKGCPHLDHGTIDVAQVMDIGMS